MIKKITTLLFIVLICSISFEAISYQTGPPTGYSNAPGDYGSCNYSGCHSGSLITSGGNYNNISMTMKLASTGAASTGYEAGKVYTITIAYSQSGINKWGFEATILDASNKKAGSLTGSGRVAYQSSTKDYVYQTYTGTSSTGTNSTDWSFTWTAPSSTSTGAVTLYLSLNAANNNNSESGDEIYAKKFTINPVASLVADARCNDSVTCAGNTVTMIGTSTGSPTSWAWSTKGGTPASSTQQYPDIKYSNPGTYYAILTTANGSGSSKPDTVKMVIKAKPSVSISGASSYSICKGDSVNLTAVSSSSNALVWTPGGSTNKSIWVKDTGNYKVMATDGNGCTNLSSTVRINHNPSYTVSLIRDTKSDTVCSTNPVLITAKASGIVIFDSLFYYSSSGLFQKTTKNPLSLQLTTSVNLYAKGKDPNGCITPASNTLKFSVFKGVSAPVGNCINKTTSGFEITWGAVTDALGYKISLDSGKTWKTPSSGSLGLSHVVVGFPPQTDIEVRLKAIYISPCNESIITKIEGGSIPCSPLTYTLEWDKEVCKGNFSTIKVTKLGSNFFSFNINGAGPYKDTSYQYKIDSSITYKFELTDSNNLTCPTIKRSAAVTAFNLPSASFTHSFSKKTATFTPNETGTAKFKWTFGDGSIDSVTKMPDHTYSITGKVWVKLKVIDANGCSSNDSMEIEVPDLGFTANTFKEYGIKVYPQPAQNSFKIDIPADLINAEIKVADNTGQVLVKTLILSKIQEIATANLANGIYFISIEKGSKRFNGKLIINK